MYKLLPLLFIVLLYNAQGFSQKTHPEDSVFIRKYWDKIHPVSTTSKSGDLYVGISNMLEVKIPQNEVFPYRFFLNTNNGSVQVINNKYVTVPQYAGNSYIRVYIINGSNDTLLIGKKRFTVLNVPDPCLKLGNTVIKEKSTVSRELLLQGDSLKLYFTEDLPESSQWYHIDYFNSGYTYGGAYFCSDNTGPFFSKSSMDIIKKQLSGQELVIKVIAVSPKAKHFRVMPIIRFRMR